MRYTATITGREIHCTIIADRHLKAPVFCCSGMAKLVTLSGGKQIRDLGSYLEVQLPDLAPDVPHTFVIAYADSVRHPANRAWLPIGPYLRANDETHALPTGPLGAVSQPLRDVPPFGGLQLIPQPTRWAPTGEYITINGFSGIDETVLALAARRALPCKGDHLVTYSDGDLPSEGYEIAITPTGTQVKGNQFYASITLLTLFQNGALPCGTITDAPRFSWRGQHLDCARHFFSVDTILDLLDLMALLKLNRFHWHFADDEAFRLQIDCYPELWQQTLGENQSLPALFSGTVTAQGSYAKDDARRIIARAKSLQIEVLPEIEAPAHSLIMTTLIDGVLDPGDNGAEISVQGYPRNALNPAMPKTWEVLENIVTEVGNLFPFNHLHLGCDELAPDTWMSSPKARALMAKEGLKNTHDLQGWTMSKLAAIVTANGQRPAAWEEAAQGSNGGIGHNAILFSWTGQAPGIAAAKAGYDVVMTPAQHAYLDMAHTDDADDWGANWAASVSLSDTVNWNPVPDADISDRIMGVQGTFWAEFTTQDSQIWPMLMPRILGIASQAWQTEPLAEIELHALAKQYQSIWPL